MKNKASTNYLEKVPTRKVGLLWDADTDGAVCLHIENKGIFNRIAQVVFKRPKVSHIHLDEFGSFIWCQIDGCSDIFAIGKAVGEHFGERADPLYERLSQFFKILEGYGFIQYK